MKEKYNLQDQKIFGCKFFICSNTDKCAKEIRNSLDKQFSDLILVVEIIELRPVWQPENTN